LLETKINCDWFTTLRPFNKREPYVSNDMSQTQAGEQILKSDDAAWQREAHFDALVSGVENYAIFLLSPEGNIVSLECWRAAH
jgi:hypothetical protein